MTKLADGWQAGDAYEAYMGRWSRPLAREFVAWLAVPPGAHWLDVGCGTGALTGTICDAAAPASVIGCDPSVPFVEHASRLVVADRARFVVADAEDPPRRDGGFDVVVASLVFNFLPDAKAAAIGIRDRLRAGATLAACVWDHADGMEFLRIFWEEAVALDARAAIVDERTRFPLCRPGALAALFEAAGFEAIATGSLGIRTDFDGFDDYWSPFLRGTGPAPSYVASLEADHREALRQRLHRRLVTWVTRGGCLRLQARAWAVRGRRA